MKRLLWFVGLISLAGISWGLDNRFFPEGPNSNSDGSGTTVGKQRGNVVFADLVSTVSSNQSRVGTVETSVTQALVPETLGTVVARGGQTSDTIIVNGQIYVDPETETETALPAIQVRSPSIAPFADFPTTVTIVSGAIIFEQSNGATSQWNAVGISSTGPNNAYSLNGSNGLVFADTGGTASALPEVRAQTVWARRDSHTARNGYAEGKVIVGPGRQDTAGGTSGTLVFGHDGEPIAGWTPGSTVGLIYTTNTIVRMESRNSTDTVSLGGTLAAPALRTNTTDTTVTGELWKGSARVPAVNQILAGDGLSATVTGSTVTIAPNGMSTTIKYTDWDSAINYTATFQNGILVSIE
jgi:hypothetical protein